MSGSVPARLYPCLFCRSYAQRTAFVALTGTALFLCTHAGVACGGLAYCLGGIDRDAPAGAFPDVYAYNPVVDFWVTCPALPVARFSMAAAQHEGCIYTCGGWADGESAARASTATALMLDPCTRAWATLPTSTASAGCVRTSWSAAMITMITMIILGATSGGGAS